MHDMNIENKIDPNITISEIEKNIHNYGRGYMLYDAGDISLIDENFIRGITGSDHEFDTKWGWEIISTAYGNIRANTFCGRSKLTFLPQDFINIFCRDNESVKIEYYRGEENHLFVKVYSDASAFITPILNYYKPAIFVRCANRRFNPEMDKEIEKLKEENRQEDIPQLIKDARTGSIKKLWENLIFPKREQYELVNDIQETFMAAYLLRLFIIGYIISNLDNKSVKSFMEDVKAQRGIHDYKVTINDNDNDYYKLNQRLKENKLL